MTNGLQVVSSALFVADVGSNRGIPSCASQIFAFAEGDVFAFRVFKAFCQAEIDDIYIILCTFVTANEEVIRLDISVNNSLFVYLLNA